MVLSIAILSITGNQVLFNYLIQRMPSGVGWGKITLILLWKLQKGDNENIDSNIIIPLSKILLRPLLVESLVIATRAHITKRQ